METIVKPWEEAILEPTRTPTANMPRLVKGARRDHAYYEISEHVKEKWEGYIAKGRVSNLRSLPEQIVRHSQREHLTNNLRNIFWVIFEARREDLLEVRSFQASWKFQPWLLIINNAVVEICGFRTIRSLTRLAGHLAREKKFYGDEEYRNWEIAKHKFLREIQGGLIRQERQPRNRWSK